MIHKYKDKKPYETIRAAKEFMLEHQISVTEIWNHDRVGLFSVRLDIDQTDIGVNGKGTSRRFALASAYGELMERLQNLVYFRFYTNLVCSEKQQLKNHVFRPIADYPDLMETFQSFIPPGSSMPLEIDKLIAFTKQKYAGDDMRCMVLREYNGTEQLILPLDYLDIGYGTNGMAAGNTASETRVQGLSEILERYAMRQCFLERLCPPPLDEAIFNSLQNREDILSWIKNIESAGDYKVRIVDLSLGKGLPVIGIILINSATASYFVKAGSHPVLEIALERCFTELMQGKTIEHFPHITNFSDFAKLRSKENINMFFKNGRGALPPNFFSRSYSWTPSLVYRSFVNNEEMEGFLTGLITQMGFRIFEVDHTCSPICAFHFVVPGMSEHAVKESEMMIARSTNNMIIGRYLQTPSRITPAQAQAILTHLEQYQYGDLDKLERIMPFTSFGSPSIYHDMPLCMFKFRLFLLLEDYESAVQCLCIFRDDLKKQGKASPFIEGYIYLLGLAHTGYGTEEAMPILKKFLLPETVDHIVEDFHGHPFATFPDYHCDYRCDRCNVHTHCLLSNAKKIYDKLLPHYTAGL